MQNPKVVVLGGGTGSFTLLSGLKEHTDKLVAIVNMADDGSSTGELRNELGVLPSGDVRQCLIALSKSPKVRELFNYRFEEGKLKGHAMGNLFLAACEKMTGDFAEAVSMAVDVLRVQGDVVPVTLDNVRLRMKWPDQELVLDGEGVIDVMEFPHDPRKAQLTLEPEAKANPKAVAAILDADLVVISPGDIYTSLGPILAIKGIQQALGDTHANVVYVCNLVTKKGQTDHFSVADHVAELERIAGRAMIDAVLYSQSDPNPNLLKKYAKAGEFWVLPNRSEFKDQHYSVMSGDFLATTAPKKKKGDMHAMHRTLIRHDMNKIATNLMHTLNETTD